MDFRVLGPLEVAVGNGPLDLGPPKQRALLALLLLNANDVVPRELAIDVLWTERPPGRAANALQVYVHGLRSVLGRDRIVLRGTGYSIRADADELDLSRFEGADRGRDHARAGHARLGGAATRIRGAANDARGVRRSVPMRERCDALGVRLRETLGRDELDRALSAGRRLGLEDAIERALAALRSPRQTGSNI